MKNKSRIFYSKFSLMCIFLFTLSVLSSCKKDEIIAGGSSTPTSLINTHFHFKLDYDGQTYSAEDGLGDYEHISMAIDSDTGAFTDWLNFSLFMCGDTSSAFFELTRAKLKPSGMPMNIQDLRQLFSPGLHNYSLNPDSGIAVTFGLSNSNYCSSILASDQSGSSFLITDTLTGAGIIGDYIKFKAVFNCKAIDSNGVQHQITNGEVVCKFEVMP